MEKRSSPAARATSSANSPAQLTTTSACASVSPSSPPKASESPRSSTRVTRAPHSMRAPARIAAPASARVYATGSVTDSPGTSSSPFAPRTTSTPFVRALAASSATASRSLLSRGCSTAPTRSTGMSSACSTDSRSCAERRIRRVSRSPGCESKPVCRMPELVPLAASANAGSASSSTTSAPRREAARATLVPTTPPPMTATLIKRATGIEPALRAWKAPVPPQHFARRKPIDYRLGPCGSFRSRSRTTA